MNRHPSGGINLPFLGVDVGSVSVGLALVEADGRVGRTAYAAHHGLIRECLQRLLAELAPGGIAGLACTSSTPPLLRSARVVDTQVAAIEAARRFHASFRSLLVIGGERFALLRFDGSGVYRGLRANSSCAAGTGSFLDQQAHRLGLRDSGELAEVALRSRQRSPGHRLALLGVRQDRPDPRPAGGLVPGGDLRRALPRPGPQRGRRPAGRPAGAGARRLRRRGGPQPGRGAPPGGAGRLAPRGGRPGPPVRRRRGGLPPARGGGRPRARRPEAGTAPPGGAAARRRGGAHLRPPAAGPRAARLPGLRRGAARRVPPRAGRPRRGGPLRPAPAGLGRGGLARGGHRLDQHQGGAAGGGAGGARLPGRQPGRGAGRPARAGRLLHPHRRPAAARRPGHPGGAGRPAARAAGWRSA